MIRRGKQLYVCTDCGQVSFVGKGWVGGGKFRQPESLLDGRQYPSCRQEERLCYSCLIVRWGEKGNPCMGFPTASVVAGLSQSSTSSALDAGPLKNLPEIWDFLTTTSMTDGTARLTGRLSLCFESGSLKLSLTDDQTRLYVSLSGKRLDDLLAEVDLRLADGSLPWKLSNFEPRGKKRK